MNNQNIIWTLKVRLIHWLIALPVLLNFILEGGEKPHRFLGYIAFIALIFRMIIGFTNKDQSRFGNFPLGLKNVKAYLSSLIQNQTVSFQGHNPLASWVYIFIWILVALLGISGYMMGLDQFWGEEWLEEIHEILSKCMMIFVGLHFLGMILDSIKFRRKTWLGMITGKKNKREKV